MKTKKAEKQRQPNPYKMEVSQSLPSPSLRCEIYFSVEPEALLNLLSLILLQIAAERPSFH